ncbi:MAG: type II secretion system F family protein [Aquihabitans sp.]
MIAAVALVVLLLGWAERRARRRTIRFARRPAAAGAPFASLGRRGGAIGARLARLRWSLGRRNDPDPAPLLRFRTAIERGASVAQAFESVAAGTGRWADGAQRLVLRVRAGAGVQSAVDAWVGEDRDPALRLLADALAISGSTGGSHVRAVDAVIDAVRERAALHREARALASQAQMSAVVLVILPIAFAVAVGALDPRVRAFYVGSPLGPACVAGGCALDVLGAVLMLRLVRGVS